jgi:hypothetical protein
MSLLPLEIPASNQSLDTHRHQTARYLRVTFFIKGKKPEGAMYILDDGHARREMIRNAGSTVSVTFLFATHSHYMDVLKPVDLGDMLDVPRREWPEHLYKEWIKMKPEHIDYLRHSVGKCSWGSRACQ